MIILLLSFTVLAIIIISWIQLLWDSMKTNVPGNIPIPLLGNGHEFMVDSSEFINVLRRIAEKYNDAGRFYLMSARYIVLSHPKYIEPLVSSSDLITKGKSYSYMKDWLGQGLLTATGHRWRTHRKFLTPAFHFNILQNFLPVFCKNERIMREKLKLLADGKPVNFFPIVALAALDNVTESIMGVCINAQRDKESEYVKAIEVLSDLISLRIRNPLIGNEMMFKLSPYKKRQDEALRILHGQTRQVIETRKAELKKSNITSLADDSEIGIRNKHAFLDLLLLAEIDGQRIDDEKIREEVDTFLFEGHDTTTSGITFCLYNISNHEDVQRKLYNEQKNIFGDNMNRDPTYSEIRQMKYLDLVIKESLRIHPSVPLIERKITHNTDLSGLHIPRNTSVIMNILQIQRNPDLYEDPLTFNPERFDVDTGTKSAFSWLPFSAGPRNCIGQKFALLEMKVAIAGIVKHFKLLPSGVEPILTADLILRSKNGVYVSLKPRN